MKRNQNHADTVGTDDMGHHLNEKGEFQSDKYPDLPPDRIVLSFHDPRARTALRMLAYAYHGVAGEDLSDDITARLDALERGSKPG